MPEAACASAAWSGAAADPWAGGTGADPWALGASGAGYFGTGTENGQLQTFGKGGKGKKGKGKGDRVLDCWNCLGGGHPSRLCPSPPGAGSAKSTPQCNLCKAFGHMKGSCTSKGGGKHEEQGGKGKGGGKGRGGAGKGKGVYELQVFSDGAWPTLAPNSPGLSQPCMMPTQEGWTYPDTYG